MTELLQTGCVLILIAAGAAAGRLSSRLRRPWWLAGYVVPLGLILMIAAARRHHALAFVAPFSWVAAGRIKFAVLAFATTAVLFTPLSRLEGVRRKVMVAAFALFMSLYAGVPPFVAPLVMRGRLEAIETKFGAGGVCLQATGYTCGPAAAVTALRALGIEAGEGDIAVRAFTNSFSGTQPDCLVLALRDRWGPEGVQCEYRAFGGVPELAGCEPVIALVRFSFLVDHYVTVLEVTPRTVVVGDPIAGRAVYSHEAFSRRWRGSGVVLRRVEVAAL